MNLNCYQRSRPVHRLCAFLFIALAAFTGDAVAQDVSDSGPIPGIRAVLTGYGAAGYGAHFDDEVQNNFSASFTPVGLFQIGEDFLYESEFELGLEGASTFVVLEHAQLHYLGFERFQITAGKFHVPFGVWMHANWINKMPTTTLLYGDAHGGVAEDALFPILFDVGVLGRGRVPLGRMWSLGVEAMITQGPALAGTDGHGDVHGEHEDEPTGHADLLPAIAYGTNYSDNNANKTLGMRLRLMQMSSWTFDVAGFHGAYDDEGELSLSVGNISAKWQPGFVDLRGEVVLLRQEYLHHGSEEATSYGGYYLQASRRLDAWEPVVRWGHLLEDEIGGETVLHERRRLSLGVNYWFAPSIPVKAAYLWELDGTDGLFVEWALGF